MKKSNAKQHWEEVYQTKVFEAVSWFQPVPETSIRFFEEMNLPKSAQIIDVGAGESYFVDYLLANGYKNITLVDISEASLARTRKRLGTAGRGIKYTVADIGDFVPQESYDFWHDRATFHFLTNSRNISHYVDTLKRFLKPNGYFLVGTFAEDGPKKCSGLDTKQYSDSTLGDLFGQFLYKIKCLNFEHLTPFDTLQKFVFCHFKNHTPA
jgi:ubiquinone/menaquinone biosynthesis C-methylase UbiE